MRVVQIMFDTLTRKYLPNYGNDWVIAPNFVRLSKRCNTFDACYGGSMPCMPARRELHTGQYNFLHRSWGPLEPFDFSVIEELKKHGVYTHLVTDHSHYFEDGGATYHNRYDTWEGFRGQEGDRWMPHDGSLKESVPTNRSSLSKQGISVNQHYANMTKQVKESDMSGVKTFMAGLDFLQHHIDRDEWFLQIETFEPHEPYEVPQQYRDMYGLNKEAACNWTAYTAVDSTTQQAQLEEIRKEYAVLLTMCDFYLGKVLDVFDEYDLWKDTALIVNTDHGFLLGEHEFIGKNFTPMYDELIHIPCFLHVPGIPDEQRFSQLTQTLDIPATLLDLFAIQRPDKMMGKSLLPLCNHEIKKLHDVVLYGVFGSYVCMNDQKYIFMKAPNQENQPLYEYTLMPTRSRGFMSAEELKNMQLCITDKYSHGVPVCKVPVSSHSYVGYHNQKVCDLLFKAQDENQMSPVQDEHIRQQYIKKLQSILVMQQAPEEQYKRLELSGML